jgi:3-deoxy-D-manno-octulosonic-acid transferase
MSFLYSLLLTLAALMAAPFYLVRYAVRGLPRGYWRERLGILADSLQQPAGADSIWIHAVSVGETIAVAGLVAELRRRCPSRPLYISHVTPTGRVAGESRIPEVTGRFYLPLDWKWAVRRVFERLHPSLLIVAETELWPNLMRVARDAGTRVVLVNARLSERSLRGYRRFGFFFRNVLGSLDHVFAQSERDARRFEQLGVARSHVSVAGNLKFDARPPEPGELSRRLRTALAGAGRGPVLVAGSTVAGEESLVLHAWERIRAQFPQAFLVLAPRHPQRFEESARLLNERGGAFVRRSALRPGARESQLASAEIVLLDSIGELAGVYELADVAFVGGSLVPKGGHNLLEPAYWSKPVLFGPHMQSFLDIAEQFVREQAGFQVGDADELGARVAELFADPQQCALVGSRAKRLLERECGATARIVSSLLAQAATDESGPLQPTAVEGCAR